MKKTEEELLLHISRLEAIIDNLPFEVWYKDINCNYLIVNKNIEEYFGKPKEEIVGKNNFELYPAAAAEAFAVSDRAAIEGVELKFFEVDFDNKIFEEYKQPVFDDTGKLIGITGFSRNITQRKKAIDELAESERDKSILLSNMPGVAFRCANDAIYTVTFISDSCYDLTGYTAEELLSMKPSYNDLIHPEYRSALIGKWDSEDAENTISTDEYPIITKSGETKWVMEQSQRVYDTEHNVIGSEGFITDVTQKKQAEEEILYLSYYDQLTGLYNRRFYVEELRRIDTERNLPITLVMADVNGLKLTNDAFGHLAGDRLLKYIADTIKKHCRADDIIARIGGDEFVMLLPQTSSDQAEKLVDRINAAISEEKSHPVVCSVSFGWDTKKKSTEEISKTYINAEDLMYRHKLTESAAMRQDTIKLIAKTLFHKNKREKLHAKRVSRLCAATAKAMGMDSEHIREMRLAGVLHNIGYIGLRNGLQNKSGSFTETERTEMERHPEIGYQLLRAVSKYSSIAESVLNHHERMDGTGYPSKAAADEIPIQSRIIAIADTFDAMTNESSYREKLSDEEAAFEIRRNAGTQFDKEIAELFVEKVLGKGN